MYFIIYIYVEFIIVINFLYFYLGCVHGICETGNGI